MKKLSYFAIRTSNFELQSWNFVNASTEPDSS